MLYVLLLVSNSLFGLETYHAVLNNNNESTQPVKADVCLYIYEWPPYVGSGIEKYKNAFALQMQPQDLLAKVLVVIDDPSVNSFTTIDLDRREGLLHKFGEHFFSLYLPLKLFKDKKDNDIIPLSFYDKSVELRYKEDSSPFFSNYEKILLKCFEIPNMQVGDKDFLEEKKIITQVGCSFYHGTVGYKSLLDHATINVLPKFLKICKNNNKYMLKDILIWTDTNRTKKFLKENRPFVEESLKAIKNIDKCMVMIANKMNSETLND